MVFCFSLALVFGLHLGLDGRLGELHHVVGVAAAVQDGGNLVVQSPLVSDHKLVLVPFENIS